MMDNATRLQKNVLIVEDDEPSQYLVQMILEDLGLGFKTAATGQDAIDMLRSEQFDLVLMDIRLPCGNGYDATRAIRQELALTVPIIAVSAHVMEWVPEKCIEAGMNEFVAKPVDTENLKAIILKYLG